MSFESQQAFQADPDSIESQGTDVSVQIAICIPASGSSAELKDDQSCRLSSGSSSGSSYRHPEEVWDKEPSFIIPRYYIDHDFPNHDPLFDLKAVARSARFGCYPQPDELKE